MPVRNSVEQVYPGLTRPSSSRPSPLAVSPRRLTSVSTSKLKIFYSIYFVFGKNLSNSTLNSTSLRALLEAAIIGLEYRYGYSVRCVHTVWKCTGNLGVALVRGRYPGNKVDTVDDLL